jgi:hypothetical protein
LIDEIEAYYEAGATDGLPVVPPTEEKVEHMIAAMGYPKDHVIGVMQPAGTPIRIQDCAVNAVLAGCLPEYGTTVLAAVRAMLDDSFTPWGVACSTKGCAPLVIVNGPIRNTIGLNSKGAVFGSGTRANATIGRAVRLVLQNVCNAKPPDLDRSTMGHPGKYTYCIAEDEESSHWTPLHVDRGFAASQSVVTLMGAEAPRLVSIVTASPEAILFAVADTISCAGVAGDISMHGDDREEGKPCLLVLGGEHRNILHAEGWSKARIRDYIMEHAVVSAEKLEKLGYPGKQSTRVFKRPEDLMIIAAGGSAGPFSCVVAGWSWMSQPVSVPI